MRSMKFKGKCLRRTSAKCSEVVRTYDLIQSAYADALDKDENIVSFHCNVHLEDFEEANLSTDFVCVKTNGDIAVRECVYRNQLIQRKICKLLDASRFYWLRRGVTDWALVLVVEEVTIDDETE